MLKKRVAGFPGLAEDLKAMQEAFASSRVGEGVQEATQQVSEGVQEATQQVSETLRSIPEDTKRTVEGALGYEVLSPLQMMSELNDLKEANSELHATVKQLVAQVKTLEQKVVELAELDKKPSK